MGFWEWLKSLFKKPEIVPPEPPPPAPKPMPPPPKEEVKEEVDWDEWAKKAAYISSTYEGKGGDYANITGNFDGAYLTCGLLGLTWKYGNIVNIMDKYLKKYGPNKLQKLMPKTGNEYLEAINAGVKAGASIVSQWSNGAKVKEPYKKELTAFWSSPEMIELQNETYSTMMGVFAKKKCLEAKEYFHLEKPLFEHYAFYWDQAVLNGTSKTIQFDEARKIDEKSVISFAQNCSGYNVSSMRKNARIWGAQLDKATFEQVHMFKLAYLRALESRSEFQGTTLMRRGTLALGIGYVNDELRKYEWS